MFMPTRRLTRLTATVLLMVSVSPAFASAGAVADLSSETLVQAETQQSNGVSLSEAVEQVRRQYGGRIISAETKRSGNREVHHIKVLTEDNKVKTVKVPGRRLNSRG